MHVNTRLTSNMSKKVNAVTLKKRRSRIDLWWKICYNNEEKEKTIDLKA